MILAPVSEPEEESEWRFSGNVAHYANLTPYRFLLAEDTVGPNLLNVGWLSRTRTVSEKGEVGVR